MSSVSRYKTRRSALKELSDLLELKDRLYVVHYSCESFYDRPDGTSPRITSIAIRQFRSGQTTSFSIHSVAERSQLSREDIEEKFNQLERAMLDEYFTFLREHSDSEYLHFSMRDANYGFLAIEHRYQVLGGSPYRVADYRKHDLARMLLEVYGTSFIEHPRLQSLVDKNEMNKIGFLTGAEEANAFESRAYVRLHQSTLRKTSIIAGLAQRAVDQTLRTNATWRQSYGTNIGALYEVVTEHPAWKMFSLVSVPASIILGIIALG